MNQFICIFFTSFISLFIYIKYFCKKKNSIDNLGNNIGSLICYYFLSALTNILLMYFILYFVLNRNELWFTVSFTIKYLLLSSFIALNLPILFNVFSAFFDKSIKNYINLFNKFVNILNKKYSKFLETFLGKKMLKFIDVIKKNKDSILYNCLFTLGVFLYFLIFDYFLRRIIYNDIVFYLPSEATPILLTFAYSTLVSLIIILVPRLVSKILFVLFSIFYLLLFVINYFMINIKSEAFSFYNLQIAGEGLDYLNFIVDVINFKFILILVLYVLVFVYLFKKIKKIRCNIAKKYKFVLFLIGVMFFLLIRCYSYSLEVYENKDGWNDINYPRFYIDNMVNSRKSFSVLGLCDYTVRDFANYMKSRNEKFGSEEEIEKIIDNSSQNKKKNKYTGLFKDKNVIMIMMESIDNIIVDEDSMPNLYKLKTNGWNFDNRYSQLSHGGSTIATEFTTLSGLWYLYDNKYDVNNYNYSIPNMFLNNKYTVSSFHENNGSYYNRIQLHQSLGFDNSYFLLDMKLDDFEYYDDEQFFTNDKLYNLVVPKNINTPFLSFITTISPHGPYKNNFVCQENEINTEKECYKYLSKRTDDMIGHMLKRLKEDNLLDDTVIILYSDHAAYSYNYSESDLKNTYKKINGTYDIKNLPFIIYNSEISVQDFDDIIVNDVDFAPTILNLFGIDYDSRYYVGSDIFSKEHKNVAMFNDYTWYDGNVHSSNAEHNQYFVETSNYVKERIDFSKMLVSNNYYKNVNSKEKK